MSDESVWAVPLRRLSIVQLHDKTFYVRPRVEALLTGVLSASRPAALVPATVVHIDTNDLSLPLIQGSLDSFQKVDDVFQKSFVIGGILIVCQANQSREQVPLADHHPQRLQCDESSLIPRDLEIYLQENETRLVVVAGESTLPEGPYFALENELHQAWRLYSDDLFAFTSPVVPDDSSPVSYDNPRFTPLQFNGQIGVGGGCVAVPSRLYFKKTPELPLNGARVSVKDNIHLNGVVTSLGNKAYTELYGKQKKTAEVLCWLISQGAVVVGKTKLSAFAGAEGPPCKSIDYFPPWNPRADGYQGSSGSSSGAASSVAGYEWLDFSLCTDTTGSMRFPAAVQGLWGVRTSWDQVPREGVVPASPSLDAISVLFRSPGQASAFLDGLGLHDDPKENWPTKILYPTDWYPVENDAHQAMTEKLVSAIESLLEVKRTPVSFEEEWSHSGPEDFRATPLAEYLKRTVGLVNEYEIYHSFDNFRTGYEERFKKKPYISPSHSARWKKGATYSEEARQKALEKMETYVSWFNGEVLQVDSTGKSTTILLVPHSSPKPSYRDLSEHDGQVGPVNNVSGPISVVSMLGPAQVVIPVGQIPYDSRISGRQEQLPAVSTLIGARGTDQTVLHVACEALKLADMPTEVQTGRFMFDVVHDEVGKILTNGIHD